MYKGTVALWYVSAYSREQRVMVHDVDTSDKDTIISTVHHLYPSVTCIIGYDDSAEVVFIVNRQEDDTLS